MTTFRAEISINDKVYKGFDKLPASLVTPFGSKSLRSMRFYKVLVISVGTFSQRLKNQLVSVRFRCFSEFLGGTFSPEK